MVMATSVILYFFLGAFATLIHSLVFSLAKFVVINIFADDSKPSSVQFLLPYFVSYGSIVMQKLKTLYIPVMLASFIILMLFHSSRISKRFLWFGFCAIAFTCFFSQILVSEYFLVAGVALLFAIVLGILFALVHFSAAWLSLVIPRTILFNRDEFDGMNNRTFIMMLASVFLYLLLGYLAMVIGIIVPFGIVWNIDGAFIYFEAILMFFGVFLIIVAAVFYPCVLLAIGSFVIVMIYYRREKFRTILWFGFCAVICICIAHQLTFGTRDVTWLSLVSAIAIGSYFALLQLLAALISLNLPFIIDSHDRPEQSQVTSSHPES